MGRRSQAEEINQAADRIVDATKELADTINRLVEYQKWFWRQFEKQTRERDPDFSSPVERQGRVGLSEDDAIGLAMEEVRATREELADVISDQEESLPPPSGEEIVEWERRRENRRREGNQ